MGPGSGSMPIRATLEHTLQFKRRRHASRSSGCVVTFKKWPENGGSSRPGSVSCIHLEQRLRRHLKPTHKFWRVDETYVRVKGRWCYLYRAIDSTGATIDSVLSGLRAHPAPIQVFGTCAIRGFPRA